MANEQNHRQTESQIHPLPYQYIDYALYLMVFCDAFDKEIKNKMA